jgi:plastocyanin
LSLQVGGVEPSVKQLDTGVLEEGPVEDRYLSEPGSYYCICTPHPWMYGQVIIE